MKSSHCIKQKPSWVISISIVCICFWLIMLISCSTPTKSEQPLPMPKFKVAEAKTAKGIESIGDKTVPLNPTESFTIMDNTVVSYIKLENLSGKHRVKWKWYDPAGSLYLATQNYTIKVPSNKYVEEASAWHKISIKGEKAQHSPGSWKVDIYLDGSIVATNSFKIQSIPQLSMPLGLPPILSIEEISFSKPLLEAGQTADLKITVENTGLGDARDMFLELYSETQELTFETKKTLPTVPEETGVYTVSIPITGKMDLKTGEASIDILLVEPHFRVKIKGKRLIFNTHAFRAPELIMAKFAAVESASSARNQQIDINEVFDLKLAIQNVGQGTANDVQIDVINEQTGVMYLGRGIGRNLSREKAKFSSIEPGKHKIITYRYFVNSDFIESSLKFTIKATEKSGTYGFTEDRVVKINTMLEEEGYIRTVAATGAVLPGTVIVEDIPDLEIDVDFKIPQTDMQNPDAIAVVIGNRNYQHKDIPVVKFARNDAEIMKQYLIQTMGYKKGNIFFETDVTKSRFEALFGIAGKHRGLVSDYIKPGISDLFIYYSGHGAPDPVDRNRYFLPSDCDPAKISLNGYPLNVFYENIAKLEAKKITIVLDSCFSGGTNSGEYLIKSASPSLIRLSDSFLHKENTAVIASSESDQISSWYDDKQHGLFTYFFLKALGGVADSDNNKKLTLKEIYHYVSDRSDGVPYWARRLHGGRLQVPTLQGYRDDDILVQLK